jgi:hypothetical protein
MKKRVGSSDGVLLETVLRFYRGIIIVWLHLNVFFPFRFITAVPERWGCRCMCGPSI